MTSKLLSPKGTLLIATTLLVSACTGNEAIKEESSAEAEAPQAPMSMGMALPGNEVESDALDADPYGSANQEGLDGFAGDRVFFAYDSSELTSDARSGLEKMADWMMHHRRARVVVEGHCDERGTREYNLALGERRATAVKNYLTALGVPASRMSTISYGKERPAVVGSGESSWKQNRRGVLVVQ